LSICCVPRAQALALLIWEAPKPRFYGFCLGLGVVSVSCSPSSCSFTHAARQLFGEAMMFVYYGYTFREHADLARLLSRRGVVRHRLPAVGQISGRVVEGRGWRHARPDLASQEHRAPARDPGPLYGQARRLLRDRVKAHDIHIGGTGLDLGSRDDQDSV
jgi:hypothetical protein